MQEEFSEIMNKLSENARFALQKSDFYSKRYNNGYMGTEHLLMGILSIDTSTGAKMLREAGATIDDVEKALNIKLHVTKDVYSVKELFNLLFM